MAIDPSLITDTLSKWQTPQFAMPDPLVQYAKLQALQNGITQQQVNQQQLQAGALDLQTKQQQIGAQKALNDAIQSSVTQGPNGTPTIDHNAVASKLTATPYAYTVPKYLEGVTAQQEADAKLQTAKLDNAKSSLDIATRAFNGATDQQTWDQALATAHGLGVDTAKMGISPVYSNQAKTAVVNYGMSVKDQLDTQSKTLEAQTKQKAETREQQTQNEKDADAALQSLAGANAQSFPALREAAVTAQTKAGRSPAAIPAAFSTESQAALTRSLLTADQRTTTDQAALNERNTEADRKVTQAQNARRIAIEGQNAGINAQKFAMEFGGDAVKGWAKQIADNPDTANQVPPALRTSVMQRFTADTGLPYPKPLAGTAVDTERASRNALDAVQQIKDALADPEIQSRVGPILGRLGNAEQTAGGAIGLSPAAEAKAQQLRTNMRYLVFQEGKALMGGRIPQNLMTQLEQSSPSVKMDAGTLNGALAGVTDAANRNLDQTFKQRFGDTATRPAPAAEAPAALPNGGGKPIDKATAKKFYDAAGGDPAKTRALIKQNNWTLQ